MYHSLFIMISQIEMKKSHALEVVPEKHPFGHSRLTMQNGNGHIATRSGHIDHRRDGPPARAHGPPVRQPAARQVHPAQRIGRPGAHEVDLKEIQIEPLEKRKSVRRKHMENVGTPF